MNPPKLGDYFVGLDNGSSRVKLYTQINGRNIKKCIPSHVGFGLSNKHSAEKGDDERTTFATKTAGGNLGLYHVNAAVPVETTSAEYQFNEVNRILVSSAIYDANLHGSDKSLYICAGLPIMAYYNTHDFSWNEGNIALVSQNLMQPVYHYADTNSDGEIKIAASPVANIKRVDVMSETVAAWMDDRMIINASGEISLDKTIANQARIYIDIGGNSTDVLIVADGKIDSASDSVQIGSNHLNDRFARLISSRAGIPRNRVTHAQIQTAMLTNQVRTPVGATVDISSELLSISNEFFSNLRHQIKGLIGYAASGVERVVFLGGTAEQNYGQLKLFDGELQRLHDEPVYANARGMWKRAKLQHQIANRQTSKSS
ncbi:StbA protein [compost metagenome]